MNKTQAGELTTDILLADILLRLTALEKMLIAKNLFTQKEFNDEMEAIAEQLSRSILQKAGVTKDLDNIINSFKKLDKN